MSVNYINDTFAKVPKTEVVNTIEIPNEDSMTEFFFDENNKSLITVK